MPHVEMPKGEVLLQYSRVRDWQSVCCWMNEFQPTDYVPDDRVCARNGSVKEFLDWGLVFSVEHREEMMTLESICVRCNRCV